MGVTSTQAGTWAIAAAVIAGILVRPWRLPEALWAVAGAVLLLLSSLMSVGSALNAIGKGTDVYLFLTGMMLLAELARQYGLFDWLAAWAVESSQGSAATLFLLVYGVGIAVTVLLSNDATAVVLTPAVYAAARKARAQPLPYLYICAFIANAASFVLPISNPANLVVYGRAMPSLAVWLGHFGIASLLSILTTYATLRYAQRSQLRMSIATNIHRATLGTGGRLAAIGIGVTAVILLVASGLNWPLGLPTCAAGATTAVVILTLRRESPVGLLKDISWSVLPLVAGLFVLVEAIAGTGILQLLTNLLHSPADAAPALTALGAGIGTAVLSNAVNNLPLGLLASSVVQAAHLPSVVGGAVLIGVDLGPNLSVTGSLATILWLVALRREGQEVSSWKFLALGALVMPPALLAALASFIWMAAR